MAITTSGGSGNTNQSLGTGAGIDLNLFTTPSTANMIFMVTAVVAGGCGVGSVVVAPSTKDDTTTVTGNQSATPTFTTNTAKAGPWAHPGNTGKEGSQTEHIKTVKLVVGPNTAVHVPIFNSDSTTRTIYVSWNYCGILFT